MLIHNIIETELWNLYNYLPSNIVDSLEIDNIVKYIEKLILDKREIGLQSTHYIDNISEHFPLYNIIKERIEQIRLYRKQLEYLKTLPKVEQRTLEWYDQRKNKLTASAFAQAINKGKFGSRHDLLMTKAFPENEKKQDSMKIAPLRHGIMLEDMTARCYSQRKGNIKLNLFGMISHPTIEYIGASPDAINELGIMVEIKTPYRRKVDGNIPEEYILQMQGQMAACNIQECDFVDAEIQTVLRDEYLSSISLSASTDHGIILEYITKTNEHKFMYSDEYFTTTECINWVTSKVNETIQNSDYKNHYIVYWKLRKILIKRVIFDEKLWESLTPQLELFWKDVIRIRSEQDNTSKSNLNYDQPHNDNETVKKQKCTYSFLDESDDE